MGGDGLCRRRTGGGKRLCRLPILAVAVAAAMAGTEATGQILLRDDNGPGPAHAPYAADAAPHPLPSVAAMPTDAARAGPQPVPPEESTWIDRIRGSVSVTGDGAFDLDIETIQPVLRLPDRGVVAFLQGRVVRRDDGSTGGDWMGTVGGGVRIDVLDAAMIGLSAFYDRTLDQRHERLSVGAELFAGPLEIRANVYESLSGARQVAWTPTLVTYEQALDGTDFTLTGPLPYLPWLTVSAGHYWWDGRIGEDLHGASVGVSARLSDRLTLRVDTRADRQSADVFGRLTVALGIPPGLGATALNTGIDSVAFRDDAWRYADLTFVERSRTMAVERWQVRQTPPPADAEDPDGEEADDGTAAIAAATPRAVTISRGT